MVPAAVDDLQYLFRSLALAAKFHDAIELSVAEPQFCQNHTRHGYCTSSWVMDAWATTALNRNSKISMEN